MSLNFGPMSEDNIGQFEGGIMGKDINMNGHNITNLPAPHGSKHAVRKKYVDDELREKLDLEGGTMTGDIDLNYRLIKNVGDALHRFDAISKFYVDSLLLDKVSSDGSIAMKDNLDMNDNKITNLSEPTDDDDAATKEYVDDEISALPSESSFFIFEFSSTNNNTYTRSRTQMSNLFWTNNRDVKITFFAHVFDDDNSISNLDLYYKIIIWSKTKVQRTVSFSKTNIREDSTITGSWLQMYELNITKTITDVKCFTMEYKYSHSSSIGNESGLHCLIEYI